MRILFLVIILLVFSDGYSQAAEPMVHVDPGATSDFPQQAPQKGVTDFAWQLQLDHPGISVYIKSHYPQGLGTAVDAAIGENAWERFDEACSDLLSGVPETGEAKRAELAEALGKSGALPSPDEGGRDFPQFTVTTYEVFRPSPEYVSLLFKTESYTGGAHGMRNYVGSTYVLASGEEIMLSDIFPDWTAASGQVINSIADGVQAQKAPGTDAVAREADTMDVRMGRIVLTPEGMRVMYDPYELGSYAEGEFMVDIPREELVRMGANTAVWGQTK